MGARVLRGSGMDFCEPNTPRRFRLRAMRFRKIAPTPTALALAHKRMHNEPTGSS